jgi:hypothetical protein
MKTLEKIMVGNGTMTDLQNIKESWKNGEHGISMWFGTELSKPFDFNSSKFSEYYESKVRKDVDYMSQFDMSYAIADSSLVANRQPNLESNPEEN